MVLSLLLVWMRRCQLCLLLMLLSPPRVSPPWMVAYHLWMRPRSMPLLLLWASQRLRPPAWARPCLLLLCLTYPHLELM